MKRLVVYYSFSGNTRAMAKRIARALRADIAEIRTIKTYPDDLDVLLGLAKREIESGYMPQIVPLSVDASKYDVIVLGTPIWWNSFAPAVKKFASSISWKGKTVYPFSTNDKGAGHAQSDFKKALRGATFAPLLNLKFDEKTLLTPLSEINEWLLGISK